ncbi:MAG: chorismate synthase [Erysipelotrichaceae bacterium]|nr:chorismate synthase [Erysipelotrichaceae bacterium]
MKNTIGTLVSVTLFGESHGEKIGCVMDGLPAGIAIDEAFLSQQIDKRRPQGTISTSRKESDIPHFVSGYFNGRTTGTPLTILMDNTQQRSQDYGQLKEIARPSHADYTAEVKYHGYQDYRGGGHFSGRLTAPLVACGAIALQMLQKKGIVIGTHIQQLYDILDEPFSCDKDQLKQQLQSLNERYLAVIQPEKEKEMVQAIEQARLQQDSLGGILESIVCGVPAGVGEPFFGSLESVISHYLFSIGGIKGVEFGLGFDFAKRKGSEANDAFIYTHQVETKTNHNGGINGGISNGMPIRLRTVVKPTPSISQRQETIHLKTHEAVQLEIQGRHDPAIIHRVRVVQDSMIALALVDLLTIRYGIGWWME